jgi:drug/metabolite transporter, DME family
LANDPLHLETATSPPSGERTGADPLPVGSDPAPGQGVDAHRWRGYFLIAAATVCWAAAATAGKTVFNGGLFAGRPLISPLLLTQARTTFTVLLLFVFLLFRYGRGFFRINRRDLMWSALAGTLGTAGSNFFYYYAIEKATVAVAITLQYTAPVWVLLFMVLARGERPTLRRVGAVVLALAGVALTIGLFQSKGLAEHRGLSLIGAGAAMVASFSFAFYNIVTPGLVRRNHPLKVMMYSLLSAAVLWALLDPPWRLVRQNFSGGQWSFLFVFACLSMLLPYVFFFNGLKYLDPTRAVIASCLEPVFAIVIAAMFVHEGIGGLQGVGVAAVLAATVLVQTSDRTIDRPGFPGKTL